MSTIRVDEEDQRQLLNELKHLREQVTHLQERGTELLMENRGLRSVLKEVAPHAYQLWSQKNSGERA